MYEAFYGFDEKPFSVPPNPAYLYLSKKHINALSRLSYSVLNKAAFTVITGDIGSGKTTLVRELIHSLDRDVNVGLLSNVNFSSFEELLQWILYSFELKYESSDKVHLFEIFTDFVIKNYAAGRRTVLIIDEAQNLAPDDLEQLRMLSNINVDQHQVLGLILVGQPSLLDTLQRPELEQFVQRIEVEYYLQPLDLEETTNYIKHRLEVAGGSPDLFAQDTYSLIWRNTSGVPRLINVLCGMALVYGFADFKEFIDADVVNQVLADKQNEFSSQQRNVGVMDMNSHVRNVPFSKEDNEFKALDQKAQKELSTIEKLFLQNNKD